MTLTVLKTFVETDLSDAALQVILDAAEEDLTAAIGSDGGVVDQRDMSGEPDLWLDRPVSSITSITETDSEGTVTTLVASDYRIHPSRMRLSRLTTGTNPQSGWTGMVTVTYAPADLNRRNRALVALVNLELAFKPGAASESQGDFSRSMQDYDAERARIIAAARSRSMA
jgi:hypothetical protein